jgi:phosphatidylinositol transfer protein SFH5
MVEEALLDVGSGACAEEIQEPQKIQPQLKGPEDPAQDTKTDESGESAGISPELQAVKLDDKPSEAPKEEPTTTAVPGTAVRQPATEEAPPPQQETTEKPPSSGPTWPELSADHPLSKLLAKLPDLLKSIDHTEVYGLDISDPTSFHAKLILQKFLRANENDVQKAEEQLRGTLEWRKEFQPLKVLDEEHSKDKFGALGYVTHLKNVPGSLREEEIVTWNIYGAVKDNKKTFGDIDR